jgi:hypothetical protein
LTKLNRCSNHNPIYLEIDFSNLKLGSPFKLTRDGLEKKNYNYLVKRECKYYDPSSRVLDSEKCVASLKFVKENAVI